MNGDRPLTQADLDLLDRPLGEVEPDDRLPLGQCILAWVGASLAAWAFVAIIAVGFLKLARVL